MNGHAQKLELTPRKAQETAAWAIEQCLGQPAADMRPLGGGLTNLVFEIEHEEGDFVIRLSPNPSGFEDFCKEQWAQARALEAGVPVTEPIKSGVSPDGIPFSLIRKAEGQDARTHPDRSAILREMGRLATLLATIPTTGFGRYFDWCAEDKRMGSWETFLIRELDAPGRLALLEEEGAISPLQARALEKILDEMLRLDDPPALAHGDIRLKNVLVNEQGAISALIDWDQCLSAIQPLWDITIALHDLNIDEKEAFLEGCGLSGAPLREIAPYIKALNMLHYAPFLRRARKRKNESRVEQLRTRLQGTLDLFSLQI